MGDRQRRTGGTEANLTGLRVKVLGGRADAQALLGGSPPAAAWPRVTISSQQKPCRREPHRHEALEFYFLCVYLMIEESRLLEAES